MTVPSGPTPLFRRVMLALKELAPYAAVELILPGGSLVALVLWLYARRRAGCGRDALEVGATPVTGGGS